MPSTYTTRNRLELQATGENTNAWGGILNDRVFQMIDALADGVASYALSGAKTLTSINGMADESRNRVQIITGGTGGTVTIPSVEKNYFVQNKATGPVIFTTGAGLTATILPGNTSHIICDGTNVSTDLALDYGVALPFTTGVPTLAAHIANKTYVDGAILTASLGSNIPTQAGKTGPLFTNGTVADFRQIVAGDVDRIVDVQEFSLSGSWTKPATFKKGYVEIFGSGAGGGSGTRLAAGSTCSGGGAGSAGARMTRWFTDAELASIVPVTIGAPGVGGAAVTTNDTTGLDGTDGGNSSFGTYLVAPGGKKGRGGQSASTGDGGVGGKTTPEDLNGTGGAGGAGANGGVGAAGGMSLQSAGGGGAGGGINAANTAFAGGDGRGRSDGNNGGATAGAGAVGASGSAGADYQGGGGGGARLSGGPAGSGGKGGRAGGGGGGGSSQNGINSGAGGNGGDGFCRVTSW